MQDYKALANIWPKIAGADIASKLVALNATITGKDDAGNDILWPFANGWRGASQDSDDPKLPAKINENDLVPAGCITEQQRQDYDVTLPGHVPPPDGSVRAYLLDNAVKGISTPAVNMMDAATKKAIDNPDPVIAISIAPVLGQKT